MKYEADISKGSTVHVNLGDSVQATIRYGGMVSGSSGLARLVVGDENQGKPIDVPFGVAIDYARLGVGEFTLCVDSSKQGRAKLTFTEYSAEYSFTTSSNNGGERTFDRDAGREFRRTLS